MRPVFSTTAVFTSLLTKFTTSLDIDIPFALLHPGGETGLLNFFDASTADQILNHGCWCSKINTLNAPGIYSTFKKPNFENFDYRPKKYYKNVRYQQISTSDTNFERIVNRSFARGSNCGRRHGSTLQKMDR